MSRGKRKTMITRDHPDLSLSRQCRLLSISRSSFYFAPRHGANGGETQENLALMRRIDALFLKYPFYGSRQMARQLRREGVRVGRHRVRRLMRLMGLVAVMDWATRHVLAWRLSNTMDAGFCVEALREALSRYGRPEIFNTDQGSQFTSVEFTGVLKDAGVAISMDGRGRCMDNIFIERMWRSLKYEAVYLHELTDGFKAERVIGEWIDFYNTERPHSALDGQTPAEAYGAWRPVDMMDKPDGLPTSPQAQQPQQDVINRFLAA